MIGNAIHGRTVSAGVDTNVVWIALLGSFVHRIFQVVPPSA